MPNQKSSKKYKVAVIGCGHWGKNLIRNFHQFGSLACVCDTVNDAASAIVEQYDVPAKSYDAILKDPEISAVVIATPADMHFSMIDAAVRANKHVFVEKPLALNIQDASKLEILASTSDRVIMVGHLMQYHPAFLKLQKDCQKGRLGPLRYIYSNRLNLGKFRTEENILWSFAPHDISMIIALFGESPSQVSAIGHSYLKQGIDDVTTTHMSFSNGHAAHIHVSWLHPFKEHRLVVIGESGMMVFDDGQNWTSKLQFFPHSINWVNGVPLSDRAEAQFIPLDQNEPLELECRHFIECIGTGMPPRTDVKEGILVLRVLDAAQRSLDSGQAETL